MANGTGFFMLVLVWRTSQLPLYSSLLNALLLRLVKTFHVNAFVENVHFSVLFKITCVPRWARPMVNLIDSLCLVGLILS